MADQMAEKPAICAWVGGLKHRYPHGCEGSNPSFGTTFTHEWRVVPRLAESEMADQMAEQIRSIFRAR